MVKALSGRESKRLSARLKSSGSLAPRPHEKAIKAQTMNIIAGYFLNIIITGGWLHAGWSNRLLPERKVRKNPGIFQNMADPVKKLF